MEGPKNTKKIKGGLETFHALDSTPGIVEKRFVKQEMISETSFRNAMNRLVLSYLTKFKDLCLEKSENKKYPLMMGSRPEMQLREGSILISYDLQPTIENDKTYILNFKCELGFDSKTKKFFIRSMDATLPDKKDNRTASGENLAYLNELKDKMKQEMLLDLLERKLDDILKEEVFDEYLEDKELIDLEITEEGIRFEFKAKSTKDDAETKKAGTEVITATPEMEVVSAPKVEVVKVEKKEVKPETIVLHPDEINEGLKSVFEEFKKVFEKTLLTEGKQSLEYYGGISREISAFLKIEPYFRFDTIPKRKVYDLGCTLSYEFKEGALFITSLSWPNHSEDLPSDLELIRKKIFDKLKESLAPELEKVLIKLCKKKYPEGEDILSLKVDKGMLDIKFGVKDEKEKVKDEASRGIRRIISEIKKFKTIDLKTSEEDLRVYIQKLVELNSFIDKVGLLDEHRNTYDSYKKSLIDVVFNKYEMKPLTVANKEIKSWHRIFGSGTVFSVDTEYDIKSLTEEYFKGDKKELLTALKNTKERMEKEGIELNSSSSLYFILSAETKEVAIKNLGTDKAKENFIALSFYKNKTIDDMIAFLEKETENKKGLKSPKEKEGDYIEFEVVGKSNVIDNEKSGPENKVFSKTENSFMIDKSATLGIIRMLIALAQNTKGKEKYVTQLETLKQKVEKASEETSEEDKKDILRELEEIKKGINKKEEVLEKKQKELSDYTEEEIREVGRKKGWSQEKIKKVIAVINNTVEQMKELEEIKKRREARKKN